MKTISFWVPGLPATAGSKTGFYNKKIKRVIMTPANKKQKPWMAVVRLKAEESYQGPVLTGPIRLNVVFRMPRPRSHYGTGKNSEILKLSAPAYHTKRPDLTKMARAIEDALTGVIWRDDSQVVKNTTLKGYDDRPGVEITIEEF